MEASSSSTPSSSWDPGKLFVGGISWETGESALQEYFEKYGEVVEAVALKDRATGNPRGFGFVQFSDPESAERALAEKEQHVILGRTVEVNRAKPRNQQHQNQDQHETKVLSNSSTSSNGNNGSHTRSKKIFVGGLSSNITEDEFRSYFEQFGTVVDVVVIYDSLTQRSRGFGFVEFDSEESVDEVMQKSFHELKNKLVEVKIAVPKDGNNYRNSGNYGRNYSSRMGGGVPSAFGNYQTGMYPTYDPRYGYYYAPPTVSGYTYGATGYGGGYPFGGYGRTGYWAPFAPPRSPWNDQGLVAATQNPVSSGNTAMYPGYHNGGVGGYMGMAGGEYHGTISGNDKWNQPGSNLQTTAVDTITSRVESLKLDAR